MEYEMKMIPVIKDTEIEKAVQKQYGTSIDLAPLMWPSNFLEGDYKALCFDDKIIAERETDKYYDDRNQKELFMVHSILKDTFPKDIRTILVDISW